MKLIGKLFLLILVLLIAVPAYFYFSFKNSNPRDLGVKYSEADFKSANAKNQVVYESLGNDVSTNVLYKTSGKRDVDTSFSSSEITAIMNGKPGVYYPYKNVQIKFNGDGTGEISGNVTKARLPGYASAFNTPKVAVEVAMKFLPDNPAFYLKGKLVITDNKISVFDPTKFEIGRVSLPIGTLLADYSLVKTANAMDVDGLVNEISGVSNKKQLVINFFNSIFSNVEGFYAKDLHFEDNKLVFKGTLPEKEETAR